MAWILTASTGSPHVAGGESAGAVLNSDCWASCILIFVSPSSSKLLINNASLPVQHSGHSHRKTPQKQSVSQKIQEWKGGKEMGEPVAYPLPGIKHLACVTPCNSEVMPRFCTLGIRFCVQKTVHQMLLKHNLETWERQHTWGSHPHLSNIYSNER